MEKTDDTWRTRFIRNQNVRTIARGMVVSLPIIIILFVISLLFRLIFNILSPISSLLYPGSTDPHWSIHLLSFIVLIVFFYMVGTMLTSKSGKYYLTKIEDEYLVQIPLYSTVRDLVQQFAGIKEMPFKRVVLIDPFNSGVLMTGFITEDCGGDIYTVFVPTAPNPANGNIYHVPASKLRFLKIGPDSALRTVVGMGTGSSCLFQDMDMKVVATSMSVEVEIVTTESGLPDRLNDDEITENNL